MGWRSKFPKSSVLDEDLIKRIKNLQNGNENLDENSATILEPPNKKTKIINNASKVKIEMNTDQDSLRMPNSRGQMNWNKTAINDLINVTNLLKRNIRPF